MCAISSRGAFVAIGESPRLNPADPDKALEAMQQGEFDTALRELRPLAAQKDPNAQFLLGMLYDAGKGVAQERWSEETKKKSLQMTKYTTLRYSHRFPRSD